MGGSTVCCGLDIVQFGFIFSWLGLLGATTFVAWHEYRHVRFEVTLEYLRQHVKEAPCSASEALNGHVVHMVCATTHFPDLTRGRTDLDFARALFSTPEIKGAALSWKAEMFQWVAHHHNGPKPPMPIMEWLDVADVHMYHAVNDIALHDLHASHGGGAAASSSSDDDMVRRLRDRASLNPHPPRNVRSDSVVARGHTVWVGNPDAPSIGYSLDGTLLRGLQASSEQSLFVKHTATRPVLGTEKQGGSHEPDLVADQIFVCPDNTLATHPCTEEADLGDIRISFKLVQPRVLSIIARQEGVAGEEKRPLASLQPARCPRLHLIASHEVGLVLNGKHDAREMLSVIGRIDALKLWAGRLFGWLIMGLSLGLLAAVCEGDVAHRVLCSFYVITFVHEMDVPDHYCWEIPELWACTLNASICVGLILPLFVFVIAAVWCCAWPERGAALLAADALLFFGFRRLLAWAAPPVRPFRRRATSIRPAYEYVEGKEDALGVRP